MSVEHLLSRDVITILYSWCSAHIDVNEDSWMYAKQGKENSSYRKTGAKLLLLSKQVYASITEGLRFKWNIWMNTVGKESQVASRRSLPSDLLLDSRRSQVDSPTLRILNTILTHLQLSNDLYFPLVELPLLTRLPSPFFEAILPLVYRRFSSESGEFFASGRIHYSYQQAYMNCLFDRPSVTDQQIEEFKKLMNDNYISKFAAVVKVVNPILLDFRFYELRIENPAVLDLAWTADHFVELQKFNATGLGLTEVPPLIELFKGGGTLTLDLSHNQITHVPSWLWKLRVSRLNLSHNQLTAFPFQLFERGGFEVDLSHNDLGDRILPFTIDRPESKSLNTLKLNSCKLTEIPAFTAKVSNLEVKRNQLTKLIIPSTVRQLQAEYNRITQVVQEDTHEVLLYLDHNRIQALELNEGCKVVSVAYNPIHHVSVANADASIYT